MKQFITLFILLSPLFLQAGTFEIDERKIDIYFANGIKTDRIGARENLGLISEAIRLERYGGSYAAMEKDLNFDTAFNETYGYAGDFYEAYLQLADESAGWATLGALVSMGLEVITGKVFTGPVWELLERLLDLSSSISEGIVRMHHDTDLSTQVAAYENSIKQGHGVVIVSHSQGNLFTNEAYAKVTASYPWMKNYFTAMAVASPATKLLENGHYDPHITFHNDPIRLIGHSFSVTTNPNLYYAGRTAANNQLIDIDSTLYHGFDYYMGERVHVVDSERDTYLSTTVGKTAIMNFLELSIANHKNAHSQWKNGLICYGTAIVKHKYAPDIISEIRGVVIALETGKLFHDGIGYVKAHPDQIIDHSNLPVEPPIVPKSGIITVHLSWEDPEIDMNLEVDMPFGEKDISDACKPIEHFYVGSESDVTPGTYPVYVRNSNGADASLIPQNIYLAVDRPGEAMTFDFTITASNMLNIGHVADIIVSERKAVAFVHIPSGEGNPPKVTHYGGSDGNGDGNSDDNPDYIRYVYDIQNRLKQALLGPLSNATIELSEAAYFQTSTPFYVSATTGGNSLLTSGLLYFPNTVLNALEDEKLYIISIIGGDDIDANDDGTLDSAATPNNGIIHAILSGKNIKSENFKVNILSEVVFQLTEEMLNGELNTTAVMQNMDDIAQKLLISDVNNDGAIDYNDVLRWLPIFDKGKLLKPYDTSYQPIVEKVYNNQYIYHDAYALVNEPLFRAQEIHVLENTEAGAVIGKVYVDLYEGFTDYTLSGPHSDFFEIAQDGTVTLSHTAELDYETARTYTLDLTVDMDSQTLSTTLQITVDDILDAPVLGGFKSHINENSPEDTFVGQLYINPGLASVTNIVLQGEGSENFTVDMEGIITVASEAILDFETKNDYTIQAIAYNAYGHSLPASIDIYLQNQPESPTLQPLTAIVRENAATGTIVGKLEIASDGPITSIHLSGEGYENFNIDINGTITVSTVAHLDYVSHQQYVLYAQATNAYGTSPSVEITIRVTPATPQLIGSYDTSGDARNVTLSKDGTLAYLADGNDGLLIMDISDPTAPLLTGSFKTGYRTNGVTISADGTLAYVATDAGLYIVNISNPTAPSYVSRRYLSGDAQSVTLSPDGAIAYVADGYSGIQIINISNPSAPSLIGSYDTPVYAWHTSLSEDGTIAYVADSKSGLLIFDVSNPSAPLLVGNYNTPSYAVSIELSSDGSIAYVADYSSGLLIFDISDPAAPSLIGSHNTPSHARDVTLSADGTVAYVADGYSGLQIIDISNPEAPLLMGSYNTPDYAFCIVTSQDNSIAYIADRYSGGLQIIDVSAFVK